jgi:uncharacterized membrane protein
VPLSAQTGETGESGEETRMVMTRTAAGIDRSSREGARRQAGAAAGRVLERVVAFAAMLWTGVMAGLFFAFSVLVMPGLDDTNGLVALPAMQSINGALDSTPFAVAFFGAAILAAVATAIAATRRDGLASWLALTAGIVYLLGVFLVTLVFNRPLNGDLDGWGILDPSSIGRMDGYIRDWSRWNDIRTVSSLVAFGLFAVAGLLRLRPAAREAPGLASGRPRAALPDRPATDALDLGV